MLGNCQPQLSSFKRVRDQYSDKALRPTQLDLHLLLRVPPSALVAGELAGLFLDSDNGIDELVLPKAQH